MEKVKVRFSICDIKYQDFHNKFPRLYEIFKSHFNGFIVIFIQNKIHDKYFRKH